MSKGTRKAGPGRKPIEGVAMATPIAIRFSPKMLAAIDMVRAKRIDGPDKSTTIRELVVEALQARGEI
jgi:hypothetical protein